jgi:hypothetical protein
MFGKIKSRRIYEKIKFGSCCFFSCLLVGCFKKNETIPPKGNLDGFLDIAWGETLSNTIIELKDKGFRITFSTEDSIMAKGKFIGKDVDLFLLFYEDMFYVVSVDFNNLGQLYEYNDLNNLLIEKYGKPNLTPIKDGDLKFTSWEFENNCNITTTFFVELNNISISYRNNSISDEKNDMERSSNLNEL